MPSIRLGCILEGFKDSENRTRWRRTLLVFSSSGTWDLFCFAFPPWIPWQGWLSQTRKSRKERPVEDHWRTIKNNKMWLWAKGAKNTKRFSFCTPSLIRDMDEHVESGAPLKNGHCDRLVMPALVSGTQHSKFAFYTLVKGLFICGLWTSTGL